MEVFANVLTVYFCDWTEVAAVLEFYATMAQDPNPGVNYFTVDLMLKSMGVDDRLLLTAMRKKGWNLKECVRTAILCVTVALDHMLSRGDEEYQLVNEDVSKINSALEEMRTFSFEEFGAVADRLQGLMEERKTYYQQLLQKLEAPRKKR